MTTDKDTNKVYFSSYIRRYRCWTNIKQALEECGVKYGFLDNTKDIWVRDFMPVEREKGKFMGYTYFPDYLKSETKYITDNVYGCYDFADTDFVKLNYIIDGGNLIKCGSKVVMTDKVLMNMDRDYRDAFLDKLGHVFDADVVIIPWDRSEPYGHADGMVRFVEDGNVLINNYGDYDMAFRDRLVKALEPHFNMISELQYGNDARKDSWAHLNFLRVGNVILVPQMNIASDGTALKQIESIYKGCRAVGVEMKNVVKRGGALNCISWNVREDEEPGFKNSFEHYAEDIRRYILNKFYVRASIADLYDVVTEGSALKPVCKDSQSDTFGFTGAVLESIRKDDLINIEKVYDDDAVTFGNPFFITYEFYVQ